MSDQNQPNENETIKRGNAILRQELDNLTPKCDVRFALLFYNILAFILLLFGFPMITSIARVSEIANDYST